MREFDETYRLRADDRDAIDDATRAAGTPDPGGRKAVVKTVAIDTYPPNDPDHIHVFFGVELMDVLDGLVATGVQFYAYNCGRRWPPLGTVIDATYVPHAWVFRYEG